MQVAAKGRVLRLWPTHHLRRAASLVLDETGVAQEWNGKWSDKSSAWNSRLRQMLAFSGASDDGTFWIEYADFVKHYNKVYMCRMLDDLWTRSTRVTHGRGLGRDWRAVPLLRLWCRGLLPLPVAPAALPSP